RSPSGTGEQRPDHPQRGALGRHHRGQCGGRAADRPVLPVLLPQGRRTHLVLAGPALPAGGPRTCRHGRQEGLVHPRRLRAHPDRGGILRRRGHRARSWILGVPFAFALGVLVFIGSFIPIVGAIVTGFLAVAVALVSHGIWTALIMLGVVLLVQQAESNLLQ